MPPNDVVELGERAELQRGAAVGLGVGLEDGDLQRRPREVRPQLLDERREVFVAARPPRRHLRAARRTYPAQCSNARAGTLGGARRRATRAGRVAAVLPAGTVRVRRRAGAGRTEEDAAR